MNASFPEKRCVKPESLETIGKWSAKAYSKPRFVVRNQTNELYSAWQFRSNWYHFTCDILPDAFLFAEETGSMPNMVFQSEANGFPGYCSELIECLGFRMSSASARTIETDGSGHLKSLSWAEFDSILCSMNLVWQEGRFSARTHWYGTQKLNAFAERNPYAPSGDVMLVQRKHHGDKATQSRNLANRDALIKALEVAGRRTTIEYMESLTVRQEMEAFRNYRTIIFVTGAAGANLAFCNRATQIVEVCPPTMWMPNYLDIASVLDLNYIAVQGTWMTSKPEVHVTPVQVQPESILRAMETLKQ